MGYRRMPYAHRERRGLLNGLKKESTSPVYITLVGSEVTEPPGYSPIGGDKTKEETGPKDKSEPKARAQMKWKRSKKNRKGREDKGIQQREHVADLDSR